MRLGPLATLCRVSEKRLLLDLRTVDESEVDVLAIRLDEAIRDTRCIVVLDPAAEGNAVSEGNTDSEEDT